MTHDQLHLTGAPVVTAGMGIRRPPDVVFDALVDPDVITKFWIVASTGPLELGGIVTWTMNAAGASAEVEVDQLDRYRHLAFDWGADGDSTHVDLQFEPWDDDGTYVSVTESGLTGDGDDLAARAADSTGGFTMVLCSLKALLEHGIELCAVTDRMKQA